MENMYQSDIADYIDNYLNQVPQELEDPFEPIMSGYAILNHRNPLHELEERLDTEHMINHGNMGIYLITDEFWQFEVPFQHDHIEKLDYGRVEYDDSYEPSFYTPDIDGEEELPSYSMSVEYQKPELEEEIEEKSGENSPEDEEEPLIDTGSSEIDFKSALLKDELILKFAETGKYGT